MILLLKPSQIMTTLFPWEKLYKKEIAPLSVFIKENMDDLLCKLNEALIQEQFENYAKGTISHYEILEKYNQFYFYLFQYIRI